jgi:nucleotide-binding universal stress UspA family protein
MDRTESTEDKMTARKVLIATDGSEHSYFAARKVHELFQGWNAEIALVYVLDSLQMSGNPEAGILPQEAAVVIKKEAEIALQTCAALWKDTKISIFMPQGRPAGEIIKTAVAWQADMIVLGTHGRTGLMHLLIGSVAESVLKKSPIPVMIVPMR